MRPAPIRTTCAYCGVGCGVLASARDGRVRVKGDPAHPANFGKLCGKGQALGETVSAKDRLSYPLIKGERVSWEEALDHIAERFLHIREAHGPDAIAFYLSGQLLTEDYYAANKLMKGFIGSGNVDTNSRLCMSSAVAGHRRAFGEDVVPGVYEDFEETDLLVLAGANAAWCHPVLFQRFEAAREKRGSRLVVIDPRKTATAQAADLHLPLKPGSDVALFNGLFRFLCEEGAADESFIARSTADFEKLLPLLNAPETELAHVAARCGLEEKLVRQFFTSVLENERWVSGFSQGINQSSRGTDKVNAIINCHLLTGRIGRPGMGPFSITGQPNAMGGREVGGLANQLAAHLSFEPEAVEKVGRFWNAPSMAASGGLKAVDLFEAVHEGKVKALWIMATNPAVSLPDAGRVRAALEKCELVIVSDCMASSDTLAYADVALPAEGWGEKDGTVTNSERRISRQRRLQAAPGEAKPDWWALMQVARRMGFGAAFPYEGPADIFREHAALSGFENKGERCFDISAYADISDAGYEAMTPFLWPARKGDKEKAAADGRLFADGKFAHEDGRARFLPLEDMLPVHGANDDFPLLLNTGRLRDQWHSMTRTGAVPRLMSHVKEPVLYCHPEDMVAFALSPKGLAEAATQWGRGLFRVAADEGLRRGEIFIPIHWTRHMSAAGTVGALVNPVTDPYSGQPEFKHTPVSVRPVRPVRAGFYLSRAAFTPEGFDYWARVPVAEGELFYLAALEDAAPFARLEEEARAWKGDVLAVEDKARGTFRRVLLEEGVPVAAFFSGPAGSVPDPSWLSEQLGRRAEGAARQALIAAAPMDPSEGGAKVCSCFGVSEKAILAAIAAKNLTSVRAVGEATQAGTNCGSCRPEIAALLERAFMKEAAE